jgi:hypothetical protein
LVSIRSQACLPSSHARSPRAEASSAMVARKSRTYRYSSTSLASSSRAWASCTLMLMPPVDKVRARLAPGFGVRLHRRPLSHLRRRPVHR